MEICKTFTVCKIPRIGLLEKPFLCGRAINFARNKSCVVGRKLRILDCRAQASGTTKASSETLGAASKDVNSKDVNLVFVAGATGKVGSRTVRELLKLGMKVRAGVRSKTRAESLVQSVRQMNLEDATNKGYQYIEKLELVECDLEKPDQIGPALGKASIVISCIGASEKEVFDITGPYRIDYMATKNLIEAATLAKVDHFILLTSLGTNKVGFPAAILNLFWGVLIWKRKAEEALIESGLPYTIVRPGGMERPTDSYKETHNITLSKEDTLFGGQVSNLQVAELMATMAKNRRISYCKVVEVIAETTAPLTPMEELLAKIPSQRIEIDPSKEPSDVDGPSPAVSDSRTSEPSIPSTLKELSPTKPTVTRLLSPYTAYEDLKPPTTPCPTPRSRTGDSKSSNMESVITASISSPPAVEIDSSAASSTDFESKDFQKQGKRGSSPYMNYPDLIPPVSPTPSTPKLREDTSFSEADPTSAASDSDTSKIMKMLADTSEPQSMTVQGQINGPLSPYTAYEDLKPPSSPRPTPSGPKEETCGALIISDITSQINGGIDLTGSGNSLVHKESPPSSAPSYSPYPAYEDLKPPSSPSPNAPVLSGNGETEPGQNAGVTRP